MNTWVQLLAADASAEELQAFGRLQADGAADDRVAADRMAALQVRAVLDDRARRSRGLAALNDIAARLAERRRPPELLTEIVDQARRLLGVDLAYLGLVEGDAMRIEVTSGALSPALTEVTIPLTAGLAGAVITDGTPRWTRDYAADRAFTHDAVADGASRSELLRGLLAVPLRSRDDVVGALFAAERRPRHFADHEVALLTALAGHAAVAIQTARTLDELQSVNEQLSLRTAELERIALWDQELTRVVLHGGGVEDLVRHLRSAVEADVTFHAGDPPRPESTDAAPDERRRLERPVAGGGEHLGWLVVTGERDLPTTDAILAERALAPLALALLRERAAAEVGHRTREALLVELLTSHGDTDTQASRARVLGLTPSDEYTVLVADGTSTAAREDLRSLPLPLHTTITALAGQLVALAPGPTATYRSTRLGHASVGLARAVDLADVPAALEHARQTLAALRSLGRRGHAADTTDLGLFHLLTSHTGRSQLQAMVDRSLGPRLRDEEARTGVPLTDTLLSYLQHGQHHRPTAQTLGIHVNTLYQRLASIDRAIGDQWRRPDQVLDVLLALTASRALSDLPASALTSRP